MSCDIDGNYDIEPGDYAASAPQRRAKVYTTEFRPPRWDENAPIIRLITAGEAACAVDPDPDRWFDQLHGGGSSIAEQKRLCAHCPLLQPCQDYALAFDVLGIWGGTTASERRQIRQDRRIKAEPVSWTYWLRADV